MEKFFSHYGEKWVKYQGIWKLKNFWVFFKTTESPTQTTDFFWKNLLLVKRFSVKTLTKWSWPVLTEKRSLNLGMNQRLRIFLKYWDYQNTELKVKLINFSIECSSPSVHFSIEILTEEINPVVTEIDELEYQHKSIKLLFLEFSDHQNVDARIKAKELSIELSSDTEKLSIEFLMERMKPVITEKYDFDNRDESKLIALFEFFWQPGYWCKEQSERLLN